METDTISCQCNVRNPISAEVEAMQANGMWETLSSEGQKAFLTEVERGRCQNPADPSSGEAFLCLDCMKTHMEANMVPKRLPKRETLYAS